MVTKKMRIKQKNSLNGYDIFHPETTAEQVLTSGGGTVATQLTEKVDKVAGKQLSTEDYSSAEKAKVAGIAVGAQVNTITSVAGKTGAVTLVKTDVGLGNVDNTSDLNKPISIATQAALQATDNSLANHFADYTKHPGYAVVTGSANTYVAVLTPAPTTLKESMTIKIKVNVTNTGASTLNVNSLGAKIIKNSNGDVLDAGTLVAGSIYTLTYDGTASFILQGEGGDTKINGETIVSTKIDSSVSKMDTIVCYNSRDVKQKLANPSLLPTDDGAGVAFSQDGVYMAVAHSASPYVTIYKRSGDTFTKLANPTTLPANGAKGVAFSQDGVYMAVAHYISPYVTIYKRSGDTFTKLANPTTLPTGYANGVAFSQDGVYMAVAHSASPYVTIYKRSGDTFTKLANPTLLPTGDGAGVAFSQDGVYMAVAHSISPYVTIYKRSGDTFTKLANPTTLPTGEAYSVAFSPSNPYLVVAHSGSPFVTMYERNGDSFTPLVNPPVFAGVMYSIAYSSDGLYMALAHVSSPYVTTYKISGNTFTKLVNPDVLPASYGYGVAFSPGGANMVVAHAKTPFISIYGDGLQVVKSDTKLVDDAQWYGYAKEHGSTGQTIKIAKLWEV